MLKWIMILSIAFLSLPAFSQLQPVSWKAELDASGDTVFVVLDGYVQEGWYVYSQFLDEGGPVPTEVSFSEGTEFLLGPTVEEGEYFYEGYDDLFGMDIAKYAKHLSLKQAVEAPEKSQISGTVIYMSCNDEMCLPPEEFDFTLQVP
jgi:thiol:disulfide interchange protein DsbD